MTSNNIQVTIHTNKGDILLDLAHDKTPITVANFLKLIDKKFYDGISFHRVIDQFMAQAGCPLGNGTGGPGYRFSDEFDASLRHERGVISMANCGPNTNGSQFFITHVPCPHLDDVHSVFGKVNNDESLAVLDSIVMGDEIKTMTINMNGIDFDFQSIFSKEVETSSSE
ncbi:MAG: peptidylprolyl isomerase [Candidatus Comchoanobacterales bacterium]